MKDASRRHEDDIRFCFLPPLTDLERGITVARLARERGLNKEQFGNRLVVNLKPRLAQLST